MSITKQSLLIKDYPFYYYSNWLIKEGRSTLKGLNLMEEKTYYWGGKINNKSIIKLLSK